MQNRFTQTVIFLFLFLLISNNKGLSQNITYTAVNQPLSAVLTKISSVYKVRFAFDDDYFSKVNVSFDVYNSSVGEFLDQLSADYPVGYKFIAGTWVIYRNDKKIDEVPSKPKMIEKLTVLPPKINRKILYKKSRLWKLDGSVVDARTGNPIAHCPIYVDEYTHPVTDDLGIWADEVLNTGFTRFKIRESGYYPLDTAFYLTDTTFIRLPLNPIAKVENLYDETYSSLFQLACSDKPYSLEINSTIGTYLPGVEHNDWANSLNLVSGYTGIEENFGGITLRDARPSDTRIIMDGIPLLNYSHLSGKISSINSKTIHQAFVSRESPGIENEGGSSGVIEFSGRSALKRPVVDFSANMLDMNLFVGIPLSKKLSFTGAVRKSITEYWPNYYYKSLMASSSMSPANGTDLTSGEKEELSNRFLDGYLRLSYQPTTRSEIDLIFSTGYDDETRKDSLSVSSQSFFLNHQSEWRNYNAGISWKFRSKNDWLNLLVVSYHQLNQQYGTDAGFDSNSGDTISFLRSDNDRNNFSEANLQWNSSFSKLKFDFQFGADYSYTQSDYQFANQSAVGCVIPADSAETDLTSQYFTKKYFKYDDSISTNGEKHRIGLFFQTTYHLFNQIDLLGGLRGSVDLSIPYLSLLPRLGVEYRSDKHSMIYYHFGKYLQSFYLADRNNSNLNAVPFWFLSSTGDQVLESFQNALGWNYGKKGLFVNIEGYWINSNGRASYFAQKGQVEQTSGDVYTLTTGTEVRQGIDAIIQFHHGLFHHSLAYSFSNSEKQFQGVNGNQSYESLSNVQHILRFNEVFSYSGWVATAGIHFFSGKPYLHQNSTNDQFEISHLSSFPQVDLSIVKKVTFSRLKVEVGASLLNVLGSKTARDIEFFNLGDYSSPHLMKFVVTGTSFAPSFFINLFFE
ncbi:MAG TPA: TonB-dependent receptor [Prolixibacteraceae bacterium]|nr:TonB-dependent receptor [Prolixibacteraceae bacterium]HPS12016.1 TonB-dependent receptor [Prolixibacteraceae bacterium]